MTIEWGAVIDNKSIQAYITEYLEQKLLNN